MNVSRRDTDLNICRFGRCVIFDAYPVDGRISGLINMNNAAGSGGNCDTRTFFGAVDDRSSASVLIGTDFGARRKFNFASIGVDSCTRCRATDDRVAATVRWFHFWMLVCPGERTAVRLGFACYRHTTCYDPEKGSFFRRNTDGACFMEVAICVERCGLDNLCASARGHYGAKRGHRHQGETEAPENTGHVFPFDVFVTRDP